MEKLIAVGLAQNNKGARNYRLVDGRTTGRYPRTREINKQGVQATELQGFARMAGIRANSRNDELYEELIAWLDKRDNSSQVQTPQLTPILPQAATAPAASETPNG